MLTQRVRRTDTSSRTGRRAANRGKQRWTALQSALLTTYSVTELLPRRAQRDFLAMLLGTTSRRVQVRRRSDRLTRHSARLKPSLQIWFQNQRAQMKAKRSGDHAPDSGGDSSDDAAPAPDDEMIPALLPHYDFIARLDRTAVPPPPPIHVVANVRAPAFTSFFFFFFFFFASIFPRFAVLLHSG